MNKEAAVKYNSQEIEKKWQQYWQDNNSFKASFDKKRKKYYLLEMLPYPSGKIHMGHVRNYTLGDAASRFRLMQGLNVIHPIGWDAFGLPAENAAIKNKIHPAIWTYNNIKEMRGQLKRLGLSYDWDREIATCHEGYYRFEQWFFLQMYKKGLAYKKKSYVNYCPDCQVVLANEQVSNGQCWRCESTVSQKELWQWYFKITAYAAELLEQLDNLKGWPERVVTMQRNWIGRSSGTNIIFEIEGRKEKLEVFTTRADTLFGVSFMSIAPEHPLVAQIIKEQKDDKLAKFVEACLRQGMISRTSEDSEKKGMFSGLYAIHPLTEETIPIYLANFVVMEYGTGAVMAVPAHDQRDFLFAKKHDLPIKIVIQPEGKELKPAELEEAWTGPGTMVNSEEFAGLDNKQGIKKVSQALEQKGKGSATINYRLRDWGVSRQRYWGAPIPIVYCDKCGEVPVPEQDLPIELPKDVQFSGKGGNPLAQVKSFVETSCPQCSAKARRETDTLDTFVESSWYFMRYLSPRYEKAMIDSEEVNYWMPVDMYIGGIEHAVGHLIYARYFSKLFRDFGLVNFDEPFTNLITQGMVLKDGEKMSKSKGNTVDPDAMIDKYGADTARLFTLFAAPIEKDLEWNERGVEGAHRFLQRVYRLLIEDWQKVKDAKKPKEWSDQEALALRRKLHQTIAKVGKDLERFHFNTAISAIMELTNHIYQLRQKEYSPELSAAVKESLPILALILSPLAPHISSELYQQLTGEKDLDKVSWPEFDPQLVTEDVSKYAVQVNGKLRGQLAVAADAQQEEVVKLAKAEEKIAPHLKDKEVKKVIFVPKRLINFVVK